MRLIWAAMFSVLSIACDAASDEQPKEAQPCVGDDNTCPEGKVCFIDGANGGLCMTDCLQRGDADCAATERCIAGPSLTICSSGRDGDACDSSSDCSGDLTCSQSNECDFGHCAPRAQRGEQCSYSNDGDLCGSVTACAAGLVCQLVEDEEPKSSTGICE